MSREWAYIWILTNKGAETLKVAVKEEDSFQTCIQEGGKF